MANQQHIKLIEKGAESWNSWRHENPNIIPDLKNANLPGKDLSNFNLSRAILAGADLTGANLCEANFKYVDLSDAILYEDNYDKNSLAKLNNVNARGVSFNRAILTRVDFSDADLRGAKFCFAELFECNFTRANLSGAWFISAYLRFIQMIKANLSNTILESATIIKSDFTDSDLTGACIYGVSIWDVNLNNCKQNELTITQLSIPFYSKEKGVITVDSLELAQFIYLLLDNKKVRDVIDTITSKVVLILGQFTEERKSVLDSIREELRKFNLTPILFDFEKPTSKDLTGTVETLARMARFIIVDLTDPKSIPHEVASIVKDLRTTPIQPIMLRGALSYSMLKDYYGSYKWLLKPYLYKDQQSLIASLHKVIAPANKMAESFRKGK